MSRRARHGFCPRCGRHAVAGDDADAVALPALADPYPLTHRGELLANVDGRRTYLLDDGRLYARDRWQLHRPAAPVLAGHRCGAPVPPDWQATTSRTPAPPDSADPPF